MKCFIPFPACALSVIFAVGAALAPSVNATPRLVIDEPHFDFGEQHNNQSIEHTFVLRNEGTSTLQITNIRSSCGCTVGHVSSHNLLPGESGKISANYNLRGRQGPQRSVLTLETNDPSNPRAQMTMGGVAVQELQVRPNRVFHGQIHTGQKSVRQIEIIGLEEHPFEIKDIESDTEWVSARALDSGPSHYYRIDIETRAPQEVGVFQNMVRIHTTHPKFPVIEVPVNAQIAGALSYAPNTISLLAGQETPVTRYVVVRPGAVQEFEITEVVPPEDDIRVQILNMPNQGYRIQLTNLLPSEKLAGSNLRIHTNVEGMDVINIPFQIIEATR